MGLFGRVKITNKEADRLVGLSARRYVDVARARAWEDLARAGLVDLKKSRDGWTVRRTRAGSLLVTAETPGSLVIP